MSAPDFYFAVNALFRHLHDTYGHDALVDYWRALGSQYYAARTERWRKEGLVGVATDWEAYFAREPAADVTVTRGANVVHLNVVRCPAIHHLRSHQRDVAPYFCEHCDHVCGAMAETAGLSFTRTGGMGSCQQQFEKKGGD